MRRIRISKGLDVPVAGAPEQRIDDGRPIETVAIVGPDYHGMKPTMAVAEGDRVKLGQPLFSDKKTEGVVYTSPAAGEVVAVNRGAKRVLQSVVIRLLGDDQETFDSFDDAELTRLDSQTIRDQLVRSGLWTALRGRPFSRVPAPESKPDVIFVTAIDTHPLAADPAPIIAERPEEFIAGLKVLARLGGRAVYVCQAAGAGIPAADVETPQDTAPIEPVAFSGPHPAGLPGTHMHFVAPVGRGRTAWQINYQDVMAVGHLFRTGRLDTRRVVALAGPMVRQPRLVRTRLGASLEDLCRDELNDGEARVISGSVLGGRRAHGPLGYLGRYHLQVSVLEEGYERQFFGWYDLGLKKASILNVVASKLTPARPLPLSTAANGSLRAIYPAGTYEKVVPLDILPTFLLRALATEDVEQAEALGCLELDEEDLALCTFVCPGKQNYGPMLRRNLTTIEKEG